MDAGHEAVRIEALTKEALAPFLDFCRAHRDGLDDSFLSEGDILKFELGPADPTFVAIGAGHGIIGAASLILGGIIKPSGRARLRVLYSLYDDPLLYGRLLSPIMEAAKGLTSIYVFIPDDNSKVTTAVERLGFILERTAYSMARKACDVLPYILPHGFSIRPFAGGLDERAWCEVRNRAFASLKGNDAPLAQEDVARMAEADGADGRMLMLLDGARPVGVVRGAFEELKGSLVFDIGPLAVLPGYQGKGLGRALLRAILAYAGERRTDAVLSVDSTNESALRLYSEEGFKKVKGFACYVLAL